MQIKTIILLIVAVLQVAAEYRKVIGNYGLPSWTTSKPKLDEFKYQPYLEITQQDLKGIAYVLTRRKDFDIVADLEVEFKARPSYSDNSSDVYTGLGKVDVRGGTQNNIVYVDKLDFSASPATPEIFKEELEAHLEHVRDEVRKYYQSRLYDVLKAMEEEYNPENDEDLISELKVRESRKNHEPDADEPTRPEKATPVKLAGDKNRNDKSRVSILAESTKASTDEL